MSGVKSYSEITETQKLEWREQFGRIVEIEIPLEEDDLNGDGDVASFVLKKPSREVLYAIANYAQEKKLRKANEVLIKNCVLGGDMSALDDDDIYFAVIEECSKLSNTKKARLKKR